MEMQVYRNSHQTRKQAAVHDNAPQRTIKQHNREKKKQEINHNASPTIQRALKTGLVIFKFPASSYYVFQL